MKEGGGKPSCSDLPCLDFLRSVVWGEIVDDGVIISCPSIYLCTP